MRDRRFWTDTAWTALITVAIVACVWIFSPPVEAHAAVRHKARIMRQHKAVRHVTRRSRRVPSHAAGQVRITRYGGRGEWQGTAGAKRIGLPSNTRDLTNAGIAFFAHRSLPFGTRVLFSHDGYQCVGICVDRGPYTSAVYDFGPILGNQLHCQGSDYVTYQVIQ